MDTAPGTRRLALPALVGGLLALPLSLPLGILATILGVAIVWFHRDPPRTPPADGFVSPADGHVSVLRREDGRVRVGVFMNVTDVHVNRAPIGEPVQNVEHVPGAHRPAFTKDSDRNERLHVDFESIRVTLIAGWFARRIHSHVEPGDDLDRGARIGHVSFGSRADVLFPPNVSMEDVTVEKGDAVRAGETVIAESEQ